MTKSGMNCWKVDRLIDIISYNCIVNIFHLNDFEWKGGVGSFSHWELTDIFDICDVEKKEVLTLSLPNMNTLTVDYFGTIPNDIIHIIFQNIDSLQDLFSLLFLNKRFFQLLRTNQGLWKSLCLKYWNHFKQQLTQQSDGNYSKEGEYNLEWIQRESGKDWIWFSQCFAKVRIFRANNYWELWIGPTPGEKVNG